MVSAGDRGQPKLSASLFCVGRRARAAWSPRRGAFRRQSRSRTQPGFHYLPRPRRRCGDKRRPERISPGMGQSSKACARPECQSNDRRPPPRRDPRRRRRRLLPADGRGRGGNGARRSRASRGGRGRSWRGSAGASSRRWATGSCWNSLRGRRRRMRRRDPEADGRAQRRRAGDQAHRLPHRRQSRRRADRGRRHFGRGRQHRGATGRRSASRAAC